MAIIPSSRLQKAIINHQGKEREKIVDAFMEHAPILDNTPERPDLSKIEILRGEDGKSYYRCPVDGEIKPLPEGLGSALLRKFQEKGETT